MVIRKGDKLNPTTIENITWEVLDVIGDLVCLQASDEKVDPYGVVSEVFWMRKSELEESRVIEKCT